MQILLMPPSRFCGPAFHIDNEPSRDLDDSLSAIRPIYCLELGELVIAYTYQPVHQVVRIARFSSHAICLSNLSASRVLRLSTDVHAKTQTSNSGTKTRKSKVIARLVRFSSLPASQVCLTLLNPPVATTESQTAATRLTRLGPRFPPRLDQSV